MTMYNMKGVTRWWTQINITLLCSFMELFFFCLFKLIVLLLLNGWVTVFSSNYFQQQQVDVFNKQVLINWLPYLPNQTKWQADKACNCLVKTIYPTKYINPRYSYTNKKTFLPCKNSSLDFLHCKFTYYKNYICTLSNWRKQWLVCLRPPRW